MCFPIVVLSFSLEQSNIHGINFDSCKRNYFLIVQYRNILKVGGLFVSLRSFIFCDLVV